jgi:hypothetical protein
LLDFREVLAMGKRDDPTCSACGEKGHKKNSNQCKERKTQGKRKADEDKGKDVKEKEEKKEEKKASKKVTSTRTPKKKPKKEKAGLQSGKSATCWRPKWVCLTTTRARFTKCARLVCLRETCTAASFLRSVSKTWTCFSKASCTNSLKRSRTELTRWEMTVHVKIARRKVRGKEVDGE